MPRYHRFLILLPNNSDCTTANSSWGKTTIKKNPTRKKKCSLRTIWKKIAIKQKYIFKKCCLIPLQLLHLSSTIQVLIFFQLPNFVFAFPCLSGVFLYFLLWWFPLISKQIQAERKLIWALVSCVVELRESKAKCPPNFWRDLNWYLSKIV